MSLSSLKLPELRAKCKEVSIRWMTLTQLKIPYSKLNKAQLIEKIQEKEATLDSPPSKKQKTEPPQPQPPSQTTSNPPPPKATANPPQVSRTAAPPIQTRPSAKVNKVVLTRTAPPPPTLPGPSAQSVPKLQSLQDKIAHIENHWLNRLFQQLHANRRQPIIKAPYPGSTKGPTNHLAFQGLHPDIYALDEEAFSVALRFWIARLHTMMQLGSGDNWGDVTNESLLGSDFSKWPRVESCARVGPLWNIKAGEYFLVLGDIGEVLAKSKDDDLTHLRSDWQNAITGAQARIYTKDDGDFPNGVRKTWSKNAPREAQEISRRAVLSSCVLNSFSGTKYTATQMDMEWRGEPNRSKATDNRLAFYLPESHKVVSVHPKGDISYIQRESGFADIVLSETGQMIGSEDGIVELWQGLLGCDAQGKAKDNGYWRDWEVRMYT